jgi:WD40 repeat protein
MQRHQTEKEFLHGSFGQWSRDNRAKCLAVRLASDGSRAFAAFEDGQIAEYAVNKDELPQLTDIFAPREQMRPATCVLSHRGAIFAGYGTGEVLGIRDKRVVFEAKMHGGVTSLCALGDRLVTGSHDCCVRLYDVERADSLCVIAGVHSSAVASVAALPGSESVLTGSQDKHLRVIDPRAGSAAAHARLADWCLCVEAVDATTVRASDKSVKLFDLRNLALPVTEEMTHRKLVSEFRSDRLRLVSCGLDGCVQVRSLEPETVAPRSTVSQLCAFTDYVLSVDFHERSLVCGTVVGALEIFQL